MTDTALDIKDLSIGYTGKRGVYTVADGINASLGKGELVALIGRNGAGKSTLLRTLAAYNSPLRGSITYDGTPLESISMSQLARKMAVVLTDTSSVANMSVRELVSLGRTPYTNFLGVLSDNDKAVAAEAMKAMGIEKFALRDIAALSDGERQKCMIAKALAQQTAVIMLDEPTAYLDYPSKVHLMRLLLRVARNEKKGIIVSTHDVDIALRMADRIWLMNGGKLMTGTVDELSQSGALNTFLDDEGVVYNIKEKRIEIKQENEIRF